MTVTDSPTTPVTVGSEGLAALLATIGEGALERERDNERPFDVIDLIRASGLGALHRGTDPQFIGPRVRLGKCDRPGRPHDGQQDQQPRAASGADGRRHLSANRLPAGDLSAAF